MKTICLNMIVKNEIETIRRSIQSVKRHIHSWVIVDTGSTDGTQKEIRHLLHDLPGELHERPWVDFGHNRNEALHLAKGKGDYLLFIDADEELICPEETSLPALDLDYYTIEHRLGNYSFNRVLLIANQEGWVWEGVVHETLAHLNALDLRSAHLGNLYKSCPPRSIALGIQKVLRDAELLEMAHRKDPQNTRTVFYLAQSYFEGRKYEQAYHYYELRAAMDGWDQEIYWAHFRKALILEYHLKATPSTFVPLYWAAYQFRPTRIEALYYLALFHAKQSQAALAVELLEKAEATPRSDDAVLVEHWMIDWGVLLLYYSCAKALGRSSVARSLADKLLREPQLPLKQREALQKTTL